jgi:hypothetical protein
MIGIGCIISLAFGRVVVEGKAIFCFVFFFFLLGYNPVWLSLGWVL